jgi:hypothetical protein
MISRSDLKGLRVIPRIFESREARTVLVENSHIVRIHLYGTKMMLGLSKIRLLYLNDDPEWGESST